MTVRLFANSFSIKAVKESRNNIKTNRGDYARPELAGQGFQTVETIRR